MRGESASYMRLKELRMNKSVHIGRLIAAVGATILAFVFSATSVIAVIWAVAKILGLLDIMLWILLALSVLPVVWATLWTAGRAWHVERLLEQGLDTDQPEFRIGAYLPLPFITRRPAQPQKPVS